jgi:Flp pilus assembly protein TadD
LDVQPDLIQGLVVRGRALLMLERFSQAETDLRRVVEQTPNNPSNLFVLGEVLRLQGEIEAAIAVYRRVLELQPGNEYVESLLRQLGAFG